MQSNRPRTLLYLLLSVSLLSLSCRKESQPMALRFYHFWSEPAQRAAMDSLIKGFEREHPDIPVETTELSWNDGKTKLMLGFNSGTAPDVLELGSDWVSQFASGGVLAPVSKDSILAKRIWASPDYSLELAHWGEDEYAVPWMLDTRVMFVNDSLVGKAGIANSTKLLENWDALRGICTRIQAAGMEGCGVNGSDEHRLYKKFLPYVWSNGGYLFNSEGKPTFSLPQNIEALTFYVGEEQFGKVETQKNLDDEFKRGRLAVWFSGSWLVDGLKYASFPWHTECVPGNAGHVGVSFAGGEYLAINAESKMSREAKIFVAYITAPQNELHFAETVNMFPADTMMQRDSFYLKRREGSVFAEQLRHSKMTPELADWLDVESILEDEVSRALYHKALPAEAMANAQKRVEELLKSH